MGMSADGLKGCVNDAHHLPENDYLNSNDRIGSSTSEEHAREKISCLRQFSSFCEEERNDAIGKRRLIASNSNADPYYSSGSQSESSEQTSEPGSNDECYGSSNVEGLYGSALSEFVACHRAPVSVFLHAITTHVGLIALFLWIFQVTESWILVKGIAIVWACILFWIVPGSRSEKFTAPGFLLGSVFFLARRHALTVDSDSSDIAATSIPPILIMFICYWVQEGAHHLVGEPTFEAVYVQEATRKKSSDLTLKTVPTMATMLQLFIADRHFRRTLLVHWVLLLPLVQNVALSLLSDFFFPFSRVMGNAMGDGALEPDLTHERHMVTLRKYAERLLRQRNSAAGITEHQYAVDLPREARESFDHILNCEEIKRAFAECCGYSAELGYDILGTTENPSSVSLLNEYYISAAEKDQVNSDQVFYTEHCDGPWGWLPKCMFGSLYRVIFAITDNTRVRTDCCLDSAAEPHKTKLSNVPLTSGRFMGFDYNRELHLIRENSESETCRERQVKQQAVRRRVVLKLHYQVVPKGFRWMGEVHAWLCAQYNFAARRLFLETLNTRQSFFRKVLAQLGVLGGTYFWSFFERNIGVANLGYVAGLSVAHYMANAALRPVIVGLCSFSHYLLYISVYYWRQSKPLNYGIFLRDALFGKLLAICVLVSTTNVGTLMRGERSWDILELSIVNILCSVLIIGGLCIHLTAAIRIGKIETYFGRELGFVSSDPMIAPLCTGFPYSVLPHPMILGQLFALSGLLMLPAAPFGAHENSTGFYLILGHLFFYALHMFQEEFQICHRSPMAVAIGEFFDIPRACVNSVVNLLWCGDLNFLFGREYIYSQAWEDPAADAELYEYRKGHRIAMITTGGDNALAALLHDPEVVLSVDLNEMQNYLLELKAACIQGLTWDECFRVFGKSEALTVLGRKECGSAGAAFGEKEAVLLGLDDGTVWQNRVAPFFRTPEAREYWDRNWRQILVNFQYSGSVRFGGYYANFMAWLSGFDKFFEELLQIDEDAKLRGQVGITLKQQRFIFDTKYSKQFDKFLYVMCFGFRKLPPLAAALGIPMRQLKLITTREPIENYARRIFTEWCQHVDFINANYFMHGFLYNRWTEECCPLWLRQKNYDTVKKNLAALEIRHGVLHECARAWVAEQREKNNNMLGAVTENSSVEKRFHRINLLDHLDWLGEELIAEEIRVYKEECLETDGDGCLCLRSAGRGNIVEGQVRPPFGTVAGDRELKIVVGGNTGFACELGSAGRNQFSDILNMYQSVFRIAFRPSQSTHHTLDSTTSTLGLLKDEELVKTERMMSPSAPLYELSTGVIVETYLQMWSAPVREALWKRFRRMEAVGSEENGTSSATSSKMIEEKLHKLWLSHFYKSQAVNYDAFRSKMLIAKKDLVPSLPLYQGDSLLLFGGGTGDLLKYFQTPEKDYLSTFQRVVNLDLCEELLANYPM